MAQRPWEGNPPNSAPDGPAGGDLGGNYPNPTIAGGAVGRAEIDPAVLQTKRVAINVAAAATEDEVIAWDAAFADANYTVQVTLEEATDDLRARRIRTPIAASVTVRVTNTDAINARAGVLHAVAIHD